MSLTVIEACRWIGLDVIDISDRGARPVTRSRQELWAALSPSPRICLWGWTTRQPQGWWSLVNQAAGRANVRNLNYRQAIQPLIDAGWASRPDSRITGQIGEVWLTRDGRNARAALHRALFLAAECRKNGKAP